MIQHYLFIIFLLGVTHYIAIWGITLFTSIGMLMNYVILVLVAMIYTVIFCRFHIHLSLTCMGKIIFSFNNRKI